MPPRSLTARRDGGPAAPDGAGQFARQLGGLGERALPVRALLAALAWGRAPGLPVDRVWLPVAVALTPEGDPRPTEDDARWLLRKGRHLLIQAAGPDGEAVCTPRGAAFTGWLRAAADAATAEAMITEALAGTVPLAEGTPEWPAAAPYLRAHLAAHAAAAGPAVLAALAADPGYLAWADPALLRPLLDPLIPELRAAARVYRRAFPLLGGDPRGNAAYLTEAATQLAPDGHGAAAPAAAWCRPIYQTRLARVPRDDSLLVCAERVPTSANGLAITTTADDRMLLVTGSDDGLVRKWDLVTGEPAGEPLTGPAGWLNEVAFGTVPGDGGGPGDGGRLLLAAGGEDGLVWLWDALAWRPAREPLAGHTGPVLRVAFGTVAGDGPGDGGRLLLASGARDRTIRVWDPVTGDPVGEPLTGHGGHVTGIAFGSAPDGRLLLASGSADGTLRLWDPLTGRPLGSPLTGHTDQVWAVAFAPSPPPASGEPWLLASAGRDHVVRLWDPLTGETYGEPLAGTAPWIEVAFGRARSGALLLAAGDFDGLVRLWDPLTGAALAELPGHGAVAGQRAAVAGMAWATLKGPDGGQALLAAGSSHGTVRLWDPDATAAAAPGDSRERRCWGDAVAFGAGPEGRALLAASDGQRSVGLWDPAAGRAVDEPMTSHGGAILSVALGRQPDGPPLLAAGTSSRTVYLWDPRAREPAGPPLAGHPGPVRSVAFGVTPDWEPLLACASDHQAWIWRPGDGQPLHKLIGHSALVRSVAMGMGPSGPVVATASDDQTVRVWHPLTGEPAGPPLAGHSGAARAVAFGVTPAGRLLLASGGDDHTALVWDALTGQLACPVLDGHGGWVSAVSFFTPAGAGLLLATGGGDATVRIWDPGSGAQLALLRRRAPVRSLAGYGPLLAVGDDEGLSVIEPAGPGFSA